MVALVEGGTRAFQVFQAPVQAAPLPPEDWSWAILDGGEGSLDQATGCYTAPITDRPLLVKIQARYRAYPEFRADALLLVLPFEPFDVVGKVLGPDWLATYSAELPFLDPDPGHPGLVYSMASCNLGRHVVGYGLPFTLRWKPLAGAQAQLLTHAEGDTASRQDVSGQAGHELTFRARVQECTVEGLKPMPYRGDAWASQAQHASILVRGFLPLAGNPLAEPGHQDGQGLSARFQEPFGLARVQDGNNLSAQTVYLATDPRSHVIRSVSREGEVLTPWGVPGQPGHRDIGAPSCLRQLACALFGGHPDPPEALFNRPTFLLAEPSSTRQGRGIQGHTWKCWVADSGNHVIRLIHSDGTSETWAGIPGRCGYQKKARRKAALFNQPQGLAKDPNGAIYVADQGNQVIRRISPQGRVDTLAGSAGEAGALDGVGSAARFGNLKGLAFSGSPTQHPWCLYALDGHAIRRISLPDGVVTTVVGVVDIPGFREVPGEDPPEDAWEGDTPKARAKAIRTPCLCDPWGITASTRGGFAIADTGNHSVRVWMPDDTTLGTIVGDPGLGQTRWGLLRDRVPAPLDERYAALDSPRTLVVGPDEPRTCLVTSGCGLGEIVPAGLVEDLQLVLDCPATTSIGHDCVIRFTVRVDPPGAQPLPMRYSVDFIEADGTLAERREGTSSIGIPVSVQGDFTQTGRGVVVVRCVTGKGTSIGIKRKLQVQ
jgi:hypothetical protein